MEVVEIYTDGTIIKDVPGWVFAAIHNNEVIFEDGGLIEDLEFAKLRNIASEMKAAVEAVRFAKRQNSKVLIYTDLQGNIEWIADLLNKNKKPWQTKNKYTQFYRKFMFENRNFIHDIRWIKGHDGNKWNEYVDKLSRKIHKEKSEDRFKSD
jgi:ribonuclease H-related protein